MSLWFNGLPGTWNPFVSIRGESGVGYQLRQFFSTTGTTFTLRGTAGNDDPDSSIENLNDSQWHHLADVWDRDNGNRFLYVDGVPDTGASIQDGSDTGSITSAAFEYLVFGSRDNNGTIANFGNNPLDEIRIYTKVSARHRLPDRRHRHRTSCET